MKIERGSKAALVSCSNGLHLKQREKIEKLRIVLQKMGLTPVGYEEIYAIESVFSGSGRERAERLMEYYRREDVSAIFDVSGGDIANEILPYLDFSEMARHSKLFWGYSDLTAILNAIYAKTNKACVLYQIRNLVSADFEKQISEFYRYLSEENQDLFSFSCRMIQGKDMEGIIVGGNIRCLLKLAGTAYWPDMNGKILLLESRGGEVPQMVTYLSQLKQLGVFEKVRGILLGTFTKMEAEGCRPDITDLVLNFAGDDLPVAKTAQVGHGTDAKAVFIGKKAQISEEDGIIYLEE